MACILQAPSKELWLIDSIMSGFTYNLIMEPIPVKNIKKSHPVIDGKGYLHFFLLTPHQQAFHMIWDHNDWVQGAFPFLEWNKILTYIDSFNTMYILVQNPSGIHILTSPITTPSIIPTGEFFSQLDPLFFIVQGSELHTYFLSNAGTAFKVIIISRQNGQILSDQTIIQNQDFYILKHWVLQSFIILVLRNRQDASAFQIVKICLRTKKKWVSEKQVAHLGKELSLYLVIDQSNYLLLFSPKENGFFYTYSNHAGEDWAPPHHSALFAPATFSEITTVNHHPTSCIAVKKIKGCALHHPLILNYSELSSLLPCTVPTLKDKKNRSTKIQKNN